MDTLVFDRIREKTEEEELNAILKPSFGGYTKKSVMDYFSDMRKQMQDQKNSYEAEIQRILYEKEKLKDENNGLREQLNVSEIEYKTLRTKMEVEPDVNLEKDINERYEELRREVALMERDLDEAIERIRDDGAKLEKYQSEIEKEKKKAKEAVDEAATLRSMMKSLQDENTGQGKTVLTLSAEIERLKEEVEYQKSVVSDRSVDELNERIDKLNGHVELLQSELKSKDEYLAQKDNSLEVMQAQDEKNRETIEMLQSAVKKCNESNEELKGMMVEFDEMIKGHMDETLALQKEALSWKTKYLIMTRKYQRATQEEV